MDWGEKIARSGSSKSVLKAKTKLNEFLNKKGVSECVKEAIQKTVDA